MRKSFSWWSLGSLVLLGCGGQDEAVQRSSQPHPGAESNARGEAPNEDAIVKPEPNDAGAVADGSDPMESSAADAGSQAPTEDPPAESDHDDQPLLVYVDVPSRVLELPSGAVWAELQSSVRIEDAARPWSPDGDQLVDVRGSSVVFLKRAEAAFVETADAELPGAELSRAEVRHWAGNDGVLATISDQLFYVRNDGALELVSDVGPIVRVTASPDGADVVFTAQVNGVLALHHASIDDGAVGSVSELLPASGSPLLTAKWTDDGRWLALGLSGEPNPGIFAFDTDADTIERISPEGADYNPLYDFAPGRHTLALYTNLEPSELGIITPGSGAGWQTIAVGDMATPAVWSNDRLLYGNSGAVELVEVQPDGSLGTRMPFPQGGLSCTLNWVSEDEFIAPSCSTAELLRGRITGGEITTEVIAPIADPYLSWGNRNCFVSYDSDVARLGTLDPEYTVKAAIPAEKRPRVFAFAPDDAGIVWSLGTSISWQALDADCGLSGVSVQLGAEEATQAQPLPSP